MQPEVIVSGIVARELIAQPRRPPRPVLGGAGLYAALAASTLAPTSLRSVVGFDLEAPVAALRSGGLDVQQVERSPLPSVLLQGSYRAHSDRLCVERAEWDCLERRQPGAPVQTRALALANDDPATQIEMLRAAEARWVLFGTFAPWLEHRAEECATIAAAAHVVTLSHHDAQASRALERAMGAGAFLIVTRGAAGVTIRGGGQTREVAAPSVAADEVVDVTGAGDVLLGALAGQLAGDDAPLDIDRVAQAVGAAAPIVAAKLRSCGAQDFSRQLIHSIAEVPA